MPWIRVQAPKQGIAGALFELGSTQQEVAHQQQQEQKRQQSIAARSGSQGLALGALPPPPPRPAQVSYLQLCCFRTCHAIYHTI